MSQSLPHQMAPATSTRVRAPLPRAGTLQTGTFHSLAQAGVPPAAVLCCASSFGHVRLFVTLWAIARQVPLSMGFSRQEYWNGLPCPPPGDLPDPRFEPTPLYISCTGRWVLYHERHLGSSSLLVSNCNSIPPVRTPTYSLRFQSLTPPHVNKAHETPGGQASGS